jgi:hypothetical protein
MPRREQAFIATFGEGAEPGSPEPDSEADSARIQAFLRTTEGAFRGHPAW